MVSPEAQSLFQGLIIVTTIAKYAKENNALQILATILPGSVNQTELLIKNISNPVLKSDFKMILGKLKRLLKEFNEGKGSFLKTEIFDQYVTNLLTKFLATQ